MNNPTKAAAKPVGRTGIRVRIILILIALLLILFVKIIRLPLQLLFKLLLHAAVGFVALFLFNYLGSYWQETYSI